MPNPPLEQLFYASLVTDLIGTALAIVSLSLMVLIFNGAWGMIKP